MKKLVLMSLTSIFALSAPVFASAINVFDDNSVIGYEDSSKLGVVPPTTVSPNPEWSGDWSGTVNYTYTSYYFRPGFFYTSAWTPHRVEYFTVDGRLIGEQVAMQYELNGAYKTSEQFEEYYYAVIHNIPHGNVAINAIYTALPN